MALFLFLGELGHDGELSRIAELVHAGEADPEDKAALAKSVGISCAGVFRKLATLRAKWAEFEVRRVVWAKTARGASCGVIRAARQIRR